MRTFYIADTHFGHNTVINFDKRPFGDIEEMEHVMVMLWNAVVKPGDRVYILGDFCWNTKNEWVRLLKLLNGQKFLINGNHDLLSYPEEVRKYFAGIYDYKKINDNGRKVIMSHFPIPTYEKSNDPNYFMLHGHVHKSKENDYLEQWKQQLREDAKTAQGLHSCNLAQIYNVGSMMPWMNYVPRTLDEIIRKEKEYRDSLQKEVS